MWKPPIGQHSPCGVCVRISVQVSAIAWRYSAERRHVTPEAATAERRLVPGALSLRSMRLRTIARAVFGTVASTVRQACRRWELAMSDTVVTDGRAERSGPADRPASSGFRWIGPMSALQALMEEQGLDGGAIIAKAGIAPGALEQPEDFIGITVLGNLLARCSE